MVNGPIYRAEVLRSRAEIDRVRSDWLRLWRTAGRSNPFNHPGWVGPWLDHLGEDIQPLVPVVFRGDRLVGLIALGRTRFGPWRRLSCLGYPIADYPDLLLAPGADDCLAVLTQALVNESWDILDLVDLPRDGDRVAEFRSHLEKNGLRTKISEGTLCPVVRVEGSWESYWATKKSKTRNTLKRKRKGLAKAGGQVRFEFLEAKDEIQAALEEASRVHAARWARQYTRTIFSDSRGQAYFNRVLDELEEDGIVRLACLRTGGRLAAFTLSFVTDQAHYYYIPGFDPEYSRYSPGHLLIQDILQAAHATGLEVFDFMRGDEDYKFRWANDQFSTVRLTAAKPNPWSRSGLNCRAGYFRFRDWARTNPGVKALYGSVMNRVVTIRKGRD